MAINPKIKQKAEDIRSKIFGSEVRESLASGIEAISEDVEATIGRQDYVEEQFQNVIDETTDKDVISAPELIAARNGKSNLKTRLDDEHAQVTAQLQQIYPKQLSNQDYFLEEKSFYDNFSSIPVGFNFRNQENYDSRFGTATKTSDGYLQVAGSDFNSPTLQIKKVFSEGVIRLLVKDTERNFALGLFNSPTTRAKMLVWIDTQSTGNPNDIQLGTISGSGAITLLKTLTMPSMGQDFYVEITVPTRYVGQVVELRTWSVTATRPSSPTATYALTAADVAVMGEDSYPNLATTRSTQKASIKEILIIDGLEYRNRLLKENSFIGRWFTRVIGGKTYMATINQGSIILSKVFANTNMAGNVDINATFLDISSSGNSPTFAVSINGGQFTRHAVAPSVKIASVPAGSVNAVRIVVSGIREHDSTWNQGQGLVFGGLTYSSAYSYSEPVKKLKRNILFIGDSIPAGVNVLGTGSTPTVNAGELAFPQIASKILGFEPYVIGFGSTGLVKPIGNGGVPHALEYAKKKMNLKPTEDYPDVIVIFEGTNDKSYGATQAQFVTAYNNLLDYLQAQYGDVPIFLMEPMVVMYNGTIIKSIADSRENCYYIDTRGMDITYSDGLHPDTGGHYVLGEGVADEIKEVVSSIV